MKKKHYLLAGLFVLMAIAWFLVEQGGTMQAAAPYLIRFSNETEGNETEYVLKRREVTATYVNDKNQTPKVSKIQWEITEGWNTVIKFKDPAKVNEATVALEAVGAGTATLSAEIDDGTGAVTHAVRTIKVGYAIDEDPKDGFLLIPELDKNAIMVLSVGDSSKNNPNNNGPDKDTNKLDLIFPCKDITWRSEDPTVISMGENTIQDSNTTGYFRAVGTGVTKITANYKSDDGKAGSVSVMAYVGPDPAYNGTPIDKTVVVKNGDPIYTGAILGDGTNKTIKDSIEWVVKDEKDIIISSSQDAEEKILISSSYSPNLTVKARAGSYYVTLYTAGVYKAGLKEHSILSETFTLVVKAEPYSTVKSLQVNDTYDIAAAYNLTPKDFSACFEVSVATGSGIISTNQIDEGIVTAVEEGKAVLELKVRDKGLLSKLTGLKETQLPSLYTIELNVYKGFTLDRTSVTITVGGSLQLQAFYNAGIAENITWKSEDENFVKVSQKGVITGVRETGGKEISVTASLRLSDGRILKATCRVLVTKTASEIILSQKELRLQVGQTATVTASFVPSEITEIPGLKWLITDEEVASIEEGSKKSVIITAKKAGTAILTAVNEDNFVAAYCKITVLAPITEISLSEGEEMTVKLSQEAIKFHAIYNSDATDVTLKWSSSNSAVAKVDETGFAELLSAGTTIITVMPEWNPKNIMAQCRLTVLQSATGFALDKSEITLEVGKKETLKPAVVPDKATTSITWKSLNSKVATVNSEGVVTAVSAGQAYIVANTENGFVDNCLVTVTQKATGVKLSDYNVTVNVGESYKVTATPNPTTSTEKSFKWESEKPSIASVKQDGTITGVSAGSTIIRVFPESGKGYAVLYVTVKDKAKGMELNYSAKSIAKGSSFTLKPIFTPTNVTNKKVTWTSSNRAIATVDSKGKVKGIKGGSAIITAVSEDGGYVATCLVTVVQPVSKIELNHNSYKLGLGKTVTLKADVSSNSSSNPKVKWTSSNTKIATVSSTGKVKAKKLGTCTITARVTDGTNKKATCKITVVRQATSVKLNRSYLTLVAGKNYRLKATVKPSNATYKTVKWSSTNSKVARVDDAGLVRGIALGSCNIKAAAKDNSKKSDTCYVEVIEPVPSTSILVADKNMVMIRGESQMLSYTIVPANSTDDVKFASANRNIATVSGTGKVYARRAGTTNITITTSSGKQTVIQLQVIGLNKTSVVLEQYDTETLFVDGVTSGISWYSANPGIATVVNGKIVGRKSGTTMIYAKVSGITLGCRVTVKNIS